MMITMTPFADFAILFIGKILSIEKKSATSIDSKVCI